MCSIENLSVHTVYIRTYAHTAYRFAFQYNVSNSFRNIPIVHVATVAAVQLA